MQTLTEEQFDSVLTILETTLEDALRAAVDRIPVPNSPPTREVPLSFGRDFKGNLFIKQVGKRIGNQMGRAT